MIKLHAHPYTFQLWAHISVSIEDSEYDLSTAWEKQRQQIVQIQTKPNCQAQGWMCLKTSLRSYSAAHSAITCRRVQSSTDLPCTHPE